MLSVPEMEAGVAVGRSSDRQPWRTMSGVRRPCSLPVHVFFSLLVISGGVGAGPGPARQPRPAAPLPTGGAHPPAPPAAADMATVLQRASLISRLRVGKAPGHGGPPQIRGGGGGVVMRSSLDAGCGEAELPRGRCVEPAPVVPFPWWWAWRRRKETEGGRFFAFRFASDPKWVVCLPTRLEDVSRR
jgi:hypothetical protein